MDGALLVWCTRPRTSQTDVTTPSRSPTKNFEAKETGTNHCIQKNRDTTILVTSLTFFSLFFFDFYRAKAIQEIKQVANFDHPHVMTYLFAWEQDETLYIMMELCERGSLSTFLTNWLSQKEDFLPEKLVWSFFTDLTLVTFTKESKSSQKIDCLFSSGTKICVSSHLFFCF